MAEESVLIPLHSVIALSLDILDHFVTKCVLKDFMALDVTTSVLVIIFQDVILKMEVARAKQDGEGSPAISLVWLGVSAKAASSDATVHTTTVFHSLVNVSKERPAQDHHAST
jgi:hypothetical protein